MKRNNKKTLLCALVILMIIGDHVSAQGNGSSLQILASRAEKMFTWHIKEAKPNGYLMFLDIPYNTKNNPRDYISLTVARRYHEPRPAFISFTLPDNVIQEKEITLLFSHSLQVDSGILYRLSYGEHKNNNHTLTARLWDGFLYKSGRSDSIDVFEKMESNRQLFISIYDSSGLHKIAIPLAFFQKQYAALPSPEPAPTYSTGNPEDTALTTKERIDKKVFENNSMPASWEIAGITDLIRLKHFIKYLRYLVDHNEKKKIAPLLVYPLKSVFPSCKDSAEFVQNYNKVFDKYVKEAIDTARMDELMRDHYGVIIGSGPNIIIRQMGDRYKISMISNDAFFKKEGSPEPAILNKR